MSRIKLLVVDDSILFREVMSRFIQQDDMIEIVGKAGDAYSARDMILKYQPDVMTLDLEMPRMDGVAFLRKLLPQYYIPTIVVSGSEEQKSICKDAGAVEFIAKPSARTNEEMAKFASELCSAIKASFKQKNVRGGLSGTSRSSSVDYSRVAAMAENAVSAARQTVSSIRDMQSRHPREEKVPTVVGEKHTKLKKTEAVIALGASTGGTEALEQVVRMFPEDTPPVVIVQHMPAGFTKMYSDRLNRSCKMEVKEAEDGDRLRSGLIIVGAGENHLRLCKDSKGYYVSSKPGEKVSGHCPSVDVLFTSVAETAGDKAIGAILTGMGRDGAEGLLKMRQTGAFTIGQDRETCVVYGMPMEAYKLGAVEVQAPLYKIADIILDDLI